MSRALTTTTGHPNNPHANALSLSISRSHTPTHTHISQDTTIHQTEIKKILSQSYMEMQINAFMVATLKALEKIQYDRALLHQLHHILLAFHTAHHNSCTSSIRARNEALKKEIQHQNGLLFNKEKKSCLFKLQFTSFLQSKTNKQKTPLDMMKQNNYEYN